MATSEHSPSLDELVSQITPENRHGETDTGIAVGNEVCPSDANSGT
jgi:antitoxin component of MazEF toxin-antitoxin module